MAQIIESIPNISEGRNQEVIEACRYYFEQTGRRITFEYSLVGGVNDTDEDAAELTRLASPLCCHINAYAFVWILRQSRWYR